LLLYRDDKLASILNINNNNSDKINSLSGDDNGEEEPFEANLINSTVYIIAMSLQVSTFAINYRVSSPRVLHARDYSIVNNRH